MNAFLSWMLFLALSGVTYYIYAKPQLPWESKNSGGDRIIVTKGKAVFAGVEEKIEKATNKKKKKGGAKEAPKAEKPKAEKPKAEKPKAEKPAKQEKAAKQEKKTDKKAEKKAQKPEPVSSSSSSSSSSESDSDVAEEEDPKEMIRRLAAARSGTPLSRPEGPSAPKASKSARGRKNVEKHASRASSTGADADIDEGEWSRPSGSDPSDMIEASGSGPRVLNIIPSAQPPKERKQKEKSESPAPGAQSKKNKKKSEKAKAAREEELAQLQASREQHRASQKAEQAAKPKPAAPAPAPADAAWTTVNGKKVATPKPSAPVSASGLLDTLSAPRPSSSSTDDDRQNMTHSSYLDQSHWQEIPKDIMDETEWSTVPTKGKKERKTTRDDSGANTPAPVEEKKVVSRPKPSLVTSSAVMVRTKSTNGFEALSDDARSSDWAEVEGWEVNPQ